MLSLTKNEAQVYRSLLSHQEGETDKNWYQVYLDNARVEGMSKRTFASVLAGLAKKGLYKPQGDDCFGDVFVDPAADLPGLHR